jgi:hypothetical protein
MAPSDLPGWVNQKQALDVRGRTPQDLAAEVQKIARQIAADKQQQVLLIAGLIALGAILLSSK